ncbi:MAG: hypothetical protein ABH919_03330 [bacterium]
MEKDFSELVEYLDKKFNNVDGKFNDIDKKFDNIDGKFDNIDNNFNQIDNKFDIVSQKIFDIDEKLERMEENKADKSDIDNLLGAVDGYAKKADTYFQEMVLLSHKVDRHEKWIQQMAEKLGVKLEY